MLFFYIIKQNIFFNKDKDHRMPSLPKTVDAYIDSFPWETQETLKKIRETILKAAPNALESISYGMPAYKLHGKVLIYFAAYKNHIGLYATPSGHKQFQKELSGFKQGKGSVQFPLTGKMPYELIDSITRFNISEIEALKKASH